MTIEHVGMIAELVAAIATLATLFYLAVQIRASVAASQAEGRRSGDADANDSIRQLAGDAELASIFMRGLQRPESLSPEEYFRFRMALSQFYTSLEAMWKEVQLGTIEENQLNDSFNARKSFFLSPGGQDWWLNNKDSFRKEFQAIFERLLRNEES